MNEKEYKELLKKVKRRLTYSHIPAVVKESRLPDSWLRRVSSGDIKRPRQERLKILAKYFGLVE